MQNNYISQPQHPNIFILNGFNDSKCFFNSYCKLSQSTFIWYEYFVIIFSNELKSTCITAIEFCSCDLNSSNGDRGKYSWPEEQLAKPYPRCVNMEW